MTWLIDHFQTIISIVLVFGLLIFIHELGHFLLAKRAGILAREFAIGFGPKIFSYKKNETRYTLRLFPLGGFVRMAGEDPEVIEIKPGQRLRILTNANGEITHFLMDEESRPHQGEEVVVTEIDLLHDLKMSAMMNEEEKHYKIDPKAEIVTKGIETQIAPWNRQFGSKTVGQRFWTIAAGPLANFLLAILLFMIYASINGVSSQAPIIGEVVEGYPAAEMGLKTGDRFLEIEGQKIKNWDQVQKLINEHPGQPLQMIFERGNEQFQATITPKASFYIASLSGGETGLMQGEEILEINQQPITSLEQAENLLKENEGRSVSITVPRLKDGERTNQTFSIDLNQVQLSIGSIGKIGMYQARDYSLGAILLSGPKETYNWIKLTFQGIGQLFTTSNPLNQVGGPVAIFKLTGDFADRGISSLIFWAAILSINLGIFNLLPIPALDGGRLVFIALEAVRGKPIDPAKESIVHFIGFAFLMLLIIIVTWNDIQKLFL